MELDRGYVRRIDENADGGAVHLRAPRGLRVRNGRALHLQDRFRRKAGGLVEDDLREPCAVADDEKGHARERPLPVQPAAQQHPPAGMRRELGREDPFHVRHLPSTTRLGVRAGGESRGATALSPSDKVSQGLVGARITVGRPTARRASLPVIAVRGSLAQTAATASSSCPAGRRRALASAIAAAPRRTMLATTITW